MTSWQQACLCLLQPADTDEPSALFHQQQWKWGGGGGKGRRDEHEGKVRHTGKYPNPQVCTVEYSRLYNLQLSWGQESCVWPFVLFFLIGMFWYMYVQVQKEPQPPEKPQKAKFRGFRNTLRSIRDKLRTDKNLVRGQFFSIPLISFLPLTSLTTHANLAVQIWIWKYLTCLNRLQ